MRIIGPAPADKLSDWDGSPLSPKLIAALTLGCVVRIFVENSQTRCGEAIYCEISKIKDGTFWGVVRDTYRLSNWIDVKSGATMTFRKDNIIEIPLTWQPKQYQKAVAHLI